MLGSGNDALDIQGTLDPDDAVKLTGTIIIAPVVGIGIDLTRPAPFDWKAQGFLVGQPVKITGFPGLTWTVIGFSDDDLTDTTDNTRMHLSGPVLTAGQIAAAPYDTLKSVDVASTVTGVASGGSIVRTDGGNWLTDGFVVGQRVTINGQGPWEIVGVFDNDNDTKFETLVLGNGPALASGSPATRTVRSVVRVVTGGDVPVLATTPITIVGGDYGGYVTRTDGLDWADFGFIEGQLVRIQGIDGSWRLRRIEGPNGSVLRLERGTALPTIAVAQTRMVYWPGPHGGLTVVHGGGNTHLSINFEMDTDGLDADSGTLTRRDGRSWIDSGFSIGQRIQVGGAGSTTWTIVDFVDSDCPFSDPVPGLWPRLDDGARASARRQHRLGRPDPRLDQRQARRARRRTRCDLDDRPDEHHGPARSRSRRCRPPRSPAPLRILDASAVSARVAPCSNPAWPSASRVSPDRSRSSR